MIANNQRYIVNIRDFNTIIVKNVKSGETKRLFKLEQLVDYIKSDINNEFYIPDIVIDGKLGE